MKDELPTTAIELLDRALESFSMEELVRFVLDWAADEAGRIRATNYAAIWSFLRHWRIAYQEEFNAVE